MKTVTVIIPVYLSSLSKDEELSFCRTLEILYNYPITIICPTHLDISLYTRLALRYGEKLIIERFDDSFFNGIKGYNRLLLSLGFYERFRTYDYILICQLDAYVFRDELMDWCDKAYDYIGAPLVGDYQDTVFSKELRVGNGGFSLRKVDAFIRYFQSKKNVYSIKQIANRIQLRNKPYTRIFVLILMVLGWRNKPLSVAERWIHNEDDFWSGLLANSNYALSMPSPTEAMLFSFERFPSELFELNHHQLPFGCHAWKKYQYETFWSKFIQSGE